jgi:hypothetical protein
MKGFLVLLVLSAVGLAGVLYWRQSLHAKAPVVAAAGAPAKDGKERRRRHKRGARRLSRNEIVARNDVHGASAPSGEAPSGEAPSGEAPRDDGPSPTYDPPPEDRAPLAPGGASTTEVGPADVLGGLSSPKGTSTPSGGRRQAVVEEPEPVKLRPADLKMVWQGEDLSKTETMRLDFSNDSSGHELSQDEIDARFRTKDDAVLGCVARSRPDEYTFVPGRVSVRFRIQRTGTVKGVQVEAPVILQKGGLTGCIKGVVGSLRFPASNASQVITYPFSLM